MRLVETIRFSPRQAVHIVEVAGKNFLIGATDQSISILSPVELPQPDEEPIQQATPALNFGTLFTNLINAPLSASGPKASVNK
jgi:flagellar biogenesis protein FliO